MRDFDEYGNLDAAASAIQGLIQGMQQGEEVKLRREERDENRKFREMELSARMKADSESKARQSAIDTYGKEKDKADRVAKLFGDGYDTSTLDESGMPTADTRYRPDYLAFKSKSDRASADPYGEKAMRAEQHRLELEKKNATREYDILPKEKQNEIDSLSKSAASRQQIKADITTSLEQLQDPKLSDDEKVIVGREAIKSLNSLQGSDAVGAEEVKRLASLLEFKIIPRIGEPGNLFQRDMEMFTKQVQNNVNRLKRNSEITDARINELYGRKGILPNGILPDGQMSQENTVQAGPGLSQAADAVLGTSKQPAQSRDSEAVAWAKKNTGDPRAKKILQMNGL